MGNARNWLMSAALVVGLQTGTVSAVSTGSSEDFLATTRDGVSLAGTLHFPSKQGPFPAIVLLHGSGLGDRTHDGYRRWVLTVVDEYDQRMSGD